MGFLGKKYTKEELASGNQTRTTSTQPTRTMEAPRQSANPICPHCGKNINERPEEVNNPAIIQHYLDSLEEDNLTAWEREFVASVSEQFDKKGSLSPKQTALLRKIYDEKGTA
jgi:hypothetical protein